MCDENDLIDWLVEYMEWDWLSSEQFYEQLKKNGLVKLKDFMSLDSQLFDLKLKAVEWDFQKKKEFVFKFHQYFAGKLPNIFMSQEKSMLHLFFLDL